MSMAKGQQSKLTVQKKDRKGAKDAKSILDPKVETLPPPQQLLSINF